MKHRSSASKPFLLCAGNSHDRFSICLSVCVCVTRRYCIKTAKQTPHDSPGNLVFWRPNSLVDDPPFHWNLWPTPFQTLQFRPLFAHSTSTVRASEKSSINANRNLGSRPCAFQRAIDEPCTLPLSPPTGWHKTRFCYFCLSKFQLLSKKVCCKVSSCENFQRQSCSYIVPLSNGPKMGCKRRPHLPKICTQSDPPPSENADFDRFRSIVPQPWELAK